MRQRRIPRIRRRFAIATSVLATVLVAAGCGSSSTSGGSTSSSGGSGSSPVTLRLGYFPNLTHAPALVGVEQGIFARDLGPGVTLQTQTFNAGPTAITALLAGSLDATFIGPSPAVNAFVKSNGQALRIIAGVTSGGAGLVVRRDAHITGPADLRGRTLATPQLGNTQDVALRAWLAAHGLKTDAQGGGDVRIVPTDNSTTLQLFKQGQIDGAWVPEPYLTRLHDESGGVILVDEATLWPGGRFETTNLVVSSAFLGTHADVVRKLVAADLDAVDFTTRHPAEAKAAVNAQLEKLTQKKLPTAELDEAWGRLSFVIDPVAASLKTSADNARTAGLLAADARLKGIYDLRILNAVLQSRGSADPVSDAGLGVG